MLDVAGRVFAERGFHEASMDEIAEGAGISKPMIYSYFGSKDGLYFAYIELAGQRLLTRMDEAAASVDDSRAVDPEARLLATSLAFFAHVDENREEWSVLFAELAAYAAVRSGQSRLETVALAGLAQVAGCRVAEGWFSLRGPFRAGYGRA